MRLKKLVKNHKAIFAVILIALVAIIALIGFQTYLYFQFIIGNDIVIKLQSDKNTLNIVYGQEEEINFNLIAIANPLCSAECETNFEDLGRNQTIKEIFSIKPGITEKKKYTVKEERLGNGQELYRYSVKCHNRKSFFCHTNEEITSRNILVNAEYSPDENGKLKIQNLKNELKEDKETLAFIGNFTEYIKNRLESINNTLKINKEEDIALIETKTKETESIFDRNYELWYEQEFLELENSILNLNKEVFILRNLTQGVNQSITNDIGEYNLLIDNLETKKNELESLKNYGFQEGDAKRLDEEIRSFNKNISFIENEKSVSGKEGAAQGILNKSYSEFYQLVNESAGRKANESLIFELEKINFPSFNFSYSFSVGEKEICCVFGKCKFCCPECKKEVVVFLHGHDFSQGVSSDYSLNAFQKLQEGIENDGVLNAGEFYLSSQKREDYGILGKSGVPISFRASYYFDVYENAGKYILVQTKTEGIDNYAIRFKEIIENIKYETGADKVIIISHSMGGLVARRYIQLFGEESVEKLVLIDVPNKGMSGKTQELCGLFGASLECKDLDAESLFLNKLNKKTDYGIPVENIIGTGCATNSGIGDGVLMDSEQEIEGNNIKNSYIYGTCSGIQLLHNEILNVFQHPEVEEKILEILKN